MPCLQTDVVKEVILFIPLLHKSVPLLPSEAMKLSPSVEDETASCSDNVMESSELSLGFPKVCPAQVRKLLGGKAG